MDTGRVTLQANDLSNQSVFADTHDLQAKSLSSSVERNHALPYQHHQSAEKRRILHSRCSVVHAYRLVALALLHMACCKCYPLQIRLTSDSCCVQRSARISVSCLVHLGAGHVFGDHQGARDFHHSSWHFYECTGKHSTRFLTRNRGL